MSTALNADTSPTFVATPQEKRVEHPFASPYDRFTRTFAKDVDTRDHTDQQAKRAASGKAHSCVTGYGEEAPTRLDWKRDHVWYSYDWIQKGDDLEHKARSPLEDNLHPAVADPSYSWAWPWAQPEGRHGNEPEPVSEISNSPASAWGPIWVMMRDEPISSDSGRTSRWLLERDNGEAGLHSELTGEEPVSSSTAGWVLHASWQVKRAGTSFSLSSDKPGDHLEIIPEVYPGG
ncbi:hypothetical protein C8Q73DRAFT_665207 [Cubamyces lactineus]|nr:hypothetical protein C8Q73DRAFT_665207 [Cubamyces lactineus]